MNVFITGIARGIGLALTIEALENGDSVFGVARHPEESEELTRLQKKYSALKVLKLDLCDPDAREKITAFLGPVEVIDVLINNAGIFEKDITKEAFFKSFETNAYIPFLVGQTLLPKLRNSKSPKAISISSTMGSIEQNTSGGSCAYRASKAALNMINKCLGLENEWLQTLVIHPGWVQTDMGGSSATTSPFESSQGIWKVIEKLNRKSSGGFKDYQGRDLPW